MDGKRTFEELSGTTEMAPDRSEPGLKPIAICSEISAYDTPMSESAFIASVGGPVPTVRAEDLRRVWSFWVSELSGAQAGIGISLNIVADLCESKADALSVWLRMTLIQALLQCGQLDPWRDGNILRDNVFEVAAIFPLPKGPAEADLGALLAAMK
jgi:hypothetical protein